MSQTAYTTAPTEGVVGAVAYGGIKPVIVSRLANGVVRAGQYVVLNGADDCQHPSSAVTAQTRGGLAIRNPYSLDGNYADNEAVNILTEGEMWCAYESAITANVTVFVRQASGGGGTQLGALRLDADTATATVVSGLYTRSAGTALVRTEVTRG
jgi:hypothetical protein